MKDLLQNLSGLFGGPLDFVAFLLYLIVFPVYHAVYPWFVRLSPNRTAKGRIDMYRRSWIQSLLDEGAVLLGAQQTRNLTMVASFLASSALILLGVTGNALLMRGSPLQAVGVEPGIAPESHHVLQVKLFLLILVFSISFMFFMACLRHLGHFNLILGADPALIEREEGIPAADYLTRIINQASNRYTLGSRTFLSALPLFLWLFSTWVFLLVTLATAVRFMGHTDFARKR